MFNSTSTKVKQDTNIPTWANNTHQCGKKKRITLLLMMITNTNCEPTYLVLQTRIKSHGKNANASGSISLCTRPMWVLSDAFWVYVLLQILHLNLPVLPHSYLMCFCKLPLYLYFLPQLLGQMKFPSLSVRWLLETNPMKNNTNWCSSIRKLIVIKYL